MLGCFNDVRCMSVSQAGASGRRITLLHFTCPLPRRHEVLRNIIFPNDFKYLGRRRCFDGRKAATDLRCKIRIAINTVPGMLRTPRTPSLPMTSTTMMTTNNSTRVHAPSSNKQSDSPSTVTHSVHMKGFTRSIPRETVLF